MVNLNTPEPELALSQHLVLNEELIVALLSTASALTATDVEDLIMPSPWLS
jgi:hypothetical protein